MTIIQVIATPPAPNADASSAANAGSGAPGADGFGAALALARGSDVQPGAQAQARSGRTQHAADAAAGDAPASPGAAARRDAGAARSAAPGASVQPGGAQAAAARLLAAQWHGAHALDGQGAAGLTQTLGERGAALLPPAGSAAAAASGGTRAMASGIAASGQVTSGQAATVPAPAWAMAQPPGAPGAAPAPRVDAASADSTGKNLPPLAAGSTASASASGSVDVLAQGADGEARAAGGARAGHAPGSAFAAALRDADAAGRAAPAAPQPAHVRLGGGDGRGGAQAAVLVHAAPAGVPGAAQGAPAPPASTAYAATLQQPVGGSAWGQELGQQMLFAVGNQQQLASLKLNPPQLGPLEVHLQLDNGQVNAQFVSPHQAVRQALESAMPQLHDLFAGAGMSLAQASVGSGGGRNLFQQAQRHAASNKGQSNGDGDSGAIDAVDASAPVLRSAIGLVNTYV